MTREGRAVVAGLVAGGLMGGAFVAAVVPDKTVAPSPTRAVAPSLPNENGEGRCGRERWDVKTLTDPAAADVDLRPSRATVAALGAVAAPADAGRLKGRVEEEKASYVVSGNVVGAKLEADSDVHLAIVDPANASRTMIVEFPSTGCLGLSRIAPQATVARAAYVRAFGLPPKSRIDRRISGCVTVTGVFFFDKMHGQFGVAPNGAELHPVTAFRKGC